MRVASELLRAVRENDAVRLGGLDAVRDFVDVDDAPSTGRYARCPFGQRSWLDGPPARELSPWSGNRTVTACGTSPAGWRETRAGGRLPSPTAPPARPGSRERARRAHRSV